MLIKLPGRFDHVTLSHGSSEGWRCISLVLFWKDSPTDIGRWAVPFMLLPSDDQFTTSFTRVLLDPFCWLVLGQQPELCHLFIRPASPRGASLISSHSHWYAQSSTAKRGQSQFPEFSGLFVSNTDQSSWIAILYPASVFVLSLSPAPSHSMCDFKGQEKEPTECEW